jgi:hypothetical protein
MLSAYTFMTWISSLIAFLYITASPEVADQSYNAYHARPPPLALLHFSNTSTSWRLSLGPRSAIVLHIFVQDERQASFVISLYRPPASHLSRGLPAHRIERRRCHRRLPAAHGVQVRTPAPGLANGI